MDIVVGVDNKGNKILFNKETMIYDSLKLRKRGYGQGLIEVLVLNGYYTLEGKSLRRVDVSKLEEKIKRLGLKIPAEVLNKKRIKKTGNNRSKLKINTISKREDYISYLNSQEWRDFREMIIGERGCFCERCDREFKSVHIHHIHYNNLKKELRGDVLVLCSGCHDLMHEHVKSQPYTIEKLNNTIGNRVKKKKYKRYRGGLF